MVYSKDEHGGGGSHCELLRWVRAIAEPRGISELAPSSTGHLGTIIEA